MDKRENLFINKDQMLKEAVEILENNYQKILIVIDSKNKLVGTITDGDIRRRLIKNDNINVTCGDVANKNCICTYSKQDIEKLTLAKRKRVTIIPLIDKNQKVIDYIEIEKPQREINNSVVIMAGGFGKRLRPLTNKVPKPLLKVGGKTILRRITDKFSNEGFNNFVISVGYLSKKIINYYKKEDKSINPQFINEEIPLGTAGPLISLLNFSDIVYPIVVTNGDIICDEYIWPILELAEKNNIDGIMLCREEFNNVPYGVVEIYQDSNFLSITEKPQYKYLVNGGIYILSSKVISLIKKDENIDMPALFLRAKLKKYKIKVFNLKGYWIDIGQLDNLQSAYQKFN